MSSGNFMFLFLFLIGPLLSVSSSSWVICWVGIELSFLGVIPLLMDDSYEMSISKEAVMKYFSVQALSSGLLMLGGVMIYMLPEYFIFKELIFLFGLFLKLGVFPLHFWVPSVVSGLSYWSIFLLLSWQKVSPLMFLINIMESFHWVQEVVLILGGMSALVGGLIGLNQSSFRAMLGSSSIAHTGWICIGSVCGSLWIYFALYCFTLFFLVCFSMYNNNLLIGLSVLSLSGLPPFLMFLGKWSILKSALLFKISYMYLIFPLAGALMSLFFYLKFFYSFYLMWGVKSFSKFSMMSGLFILSLSGMMFMMIF